MPTAPLDPKAVLEVDGYLEPNVPSIIHRHDLYRQWKDRIDEQEGGYEGFSKGFNKFGFNVRENGDVVYREWAPNATEAYLIGEFSECPCIPAFARAYLRVDDWNRISHPMKKDNYGVWEVTVPAKDGVCAIPHDSKLKVRGASRRPLPAY